MGYSEHRDTGVAGELLVAGRLILEGYTVFREVSDTSKVDLLVVVNGHYVRIQVKTLHSLSDGAVVGVDRFKKGRTGNFIEYSSDEVDVIATYVYDLGKLIFVSTRELEESGQRSISIRFTEPKNNQKKHTRYWNDYTSFTQAWARSSEAKADGSYP
jgi:hypothetical protein